MKTLVFKKWYQKQNWAFDEKLSDIQAANVESVNCVLVGQTEKAIICEHINCYNGSFGKIYFPKSALIVMEEGDNQHYKEMNKLENKEIALIEVNEYLATTEFADAKLVMAMARDCNLNKKY